MKYEIKGGNLPYVICHLNKGQTITCEPGSMSWMTPSMNMETDTSGGFKTVFKRALSGEHLFVNHYTAMEDDSIIAFSSSFPGEILAIDIDDGKEIICQGSSFLAGTENITFTAQFNNDARIGFFGEGFVMQRIGGKGTVFLEVDGSTQEYNLKENEKMTISTGFLVMMDSTCKMDVVRVGDMKKSFLGGQGFYNTIITGPGKIILQSMPVSRMADSLEPFLPDKSSN